jgi:hypothetical protein
VPCSAWCDPGALPPNLATLFRIIEWLRRRTAARTTARDATLFLIEAAGELILINSRRDMCF